MGAFKYIKESFAKTFKTKPEFHRKRLQAWRRTSSVVRVANPFNPGRARELGYKASKDFIVIRVKTPRGKVKRKRPDLGRKPAKNRLKENPGKPWSWFATQKAQRRYPHFKAINAYWIGEDGSNQYFEVILKSRSA